MKYKKFTSLGIIYILTIFLFGGLRNSIPESFLEWGSLGIFISGILYVFSFTAPIATAMILIFSVNKNILFLGLIAGVGSLIGDLIIFHFIRISFADEIKEISEHKFSVLTIKKIPQSYQKYVAFIVGALFISTPLPDEIGIAILASSKEVKLNHFGIISYTLNTLGIFLIIILRNIF
ncbi:MAG: hypothetical protein APG12_00594 [Candidatus Methanofastidiosum methylothiophilum]|uniref:SNARE associated Golgi protein n=1 Tax=Candidatus Methanofastidiosum methylothiophilum TaxID=1705564 RepID=A0A150IL73_9EURY|nr:MAG: hypothetical protein APG10_00543 [Candidatus Methanofastidiosum methylthiophilus]KYC47992.1 MAG: hypothetical protein APG11_00662 [Candidatus Methanofastidiosum methylthiophilus]KYC50682.1 MAG: hypothetical protein APG12_00594 [Candidatus Methanofastidiosum methylthiophilus]